jgi:isoleucyl-tRNA synthetase
MGRADPVLPAQRDGALHPDMAEILEEVAQRIEKGGIEAWQRVTAEELLGADAKDYEKARETLDVWFDSGTTHFTVLRGSHKSESDVPGRHVPRKAPTSTAAGSTRRFSPRP